MKFILHIANYRHAPFTDIVPALNAFRDHINAFLKSGGGTCGVEDGYFLYIENGDHSAVLGIIEVLDLAERLGLFDEEGNVRNIPDRGHRIAHEVFGPGRSSIHQVVRELGLLDPL